MAGKGNAGIVDHPLMHRRRDDAGKFAGLAAGQRPIQQRQHIGAIGRIKPPRFSGRGKRKVQNIEMPRKRSLSRHIRTKGRHQTQSGRPRFKQAAIPQHDDWPFALGQTQAKLGADSGRFAGGHG
ncbi:MAG: hypothetical protein BWY57_00257 [Betaproteobacteria bacterium ADurb.Bin341]|nr:MAG: hypothetical protein BWY57_00257 [Betaproteobacteria bacterium ADurb.Bin341]